jgi:FkbM family methyltransferase
MNIELFFVRLDKILQTFKSYILLKIFLRYRVLASTEHRFVLNRPFATVVDIGSNRGQFSLACLKWAPKARVFAFEPQARPCHIYRQIFLSLGNFSMHEVAIGPSRCRNTMHLSASDDSSSLLPISNNQQSIYPGTEEVGVIQVDVAPMGDFISAGQLIAPAILKIDVQGFELDVLKGSESLLSRFSCIYCECSFIELYTGQKLAHEIIEWLGQRGFNLSGIYNLSCDYLGRTIQADFLFESY